MTVSTPITPVEPQVSTDSTSTWAFVACSSWLSGQKFDIKSKTGAPVIKVGRGKHCDIIFPGTHLSREHVEIRILDDHIHIKDLGSVNGTFINEVRVNEGILRPGDKLRLDVYSFSVLWPSAIPTAANDTPEEDANATKLRASDAPVPPTPLFQAAPETLPEKQWVTKPTSPGNRIEETPIEDKSNLAPLWIATIGLSAAVIGLTVYMFF